VDYPISVPSIGLVDGKFADEDPLGGSPGSLIPAQWGNAVTQELLAVIADAGFAPDEHNNAQLLAAIKAIIGTAVPAATEAVAGRSKVSTQAQVTTGTDDATFITPKKLAVRLAAGAPMMCIPPSLKMTVAAANTQATISADEVLVKSALAGRAWTLGAFTKLINLANVGALGMDFGQAPASGFLAIYAGLNESTGATTAFAQSVGNAYAPQVYAGVNAPLGITATALLTVVPTTAAGQFKICHVSGRVVSIALTAIFNSSAIVASTPFSIAAVVPYNAKRICGEISIGSSLASTLSLTVRPDISGVGQVNKTSTVGAGQLFTDNYPFMPIVAPQLAMIDTNSTAGTPTFFLYVASYEL